MPQPIENQLELEALGLETLGWKESFDNGPFQAQAVFKTAWADRFETVEKLLGGINGANIQLPVRYDRFTKSDGAGGTEDTTINQPMIVALSALSESFLQEDLSDTTVAVAVPNFARITVDFGAPTWTFSKSIDGTSDNSNSDWVLTEQIIPAAEHLAVSEDDVFWQDGNDYIPLTEKESISIVVPTATWIVTVHYVPKSDIDEKQIAPLIGSVNQNRLLSPFYNVIFEAETLLFTSYSVDSVDTPFGTHYDVTFNLEWRPSENVIPPATTSAARLAGVVAAVADHIPKGWNTLYRSKTQQYEPIYTKDTEIIDNPDEGTSEEVRKPYRAYKRKDWNSWLPKPAATP